MAAPIGNQYAIGNTGGGRPSTYKPEYAKIAQKACSIGFTDRELADLFEVSVSTIGRWKLENEEFLNALKMGKDPADDRVEQSLFHRAVGYEHDEVDIRVVQGEVVQTPIRKYYPPDTTACIFWLKNRRKDEWREKVEGPNDGDETPDPVQIVFNVTDARA